MRVTINQNPLVKFPTPNDNTLRVILDLSITRYTDAAKRLRIYWLGPNVELGNINIDDCPVGLGLGPAVKAFLIISGIQPPLDSRRDTLTGQVRNLLFSDTLYFVGYAAIPAIVEATVYANYAHMAGETQERDNILNEISNEVKELLTRLAADDVQIDAFKVGYDSNVNNYYVYLKASPKTA